MKIAFGCDKNELLTDKHFGDSELFMIYELKNNDIVFIESRENIKFDEEKHGDSKKAKHISNQLYDIDILVAKVFGPNIKNIRKNFIPVIIKNNNFNKFLNKIIENQDFFEAEIGNEIKNILIV